MVLGSCQQSAEYSTIRATSLPESGDTAGECTGCWCCTTPHEHADLTESARDELAYFVRGIPEAGAFRGFALRYYLLALRHVAEGRMLGLAKRA